MTDMDAVIEAMRERGIDTSQFHPVGMDVPEFVASIVSSLQQQVANGIQLCESLKEHIHQMQDRCEFWKEMSDRAESSAKAEVQKEMAELRRVNSKLQMRVREQTAATIACNDRNRNAVLEVLTLNGVLPDTVDPYGHPIEQVVGTCIHRLLAKIERLERGNQG